jgi:magnesium transporter
MGGIAGSQTLTLVIRGQALGHIERHNIGWLFNREMVVSLINGIIWAAVVAAVSMLWFQDTTIGIVIALAIVINLLAGAMAGSLLPMFLKQAGIDPALAGGVLLTTITDVVGFFAFLGLATFFYG